MNFQAKVEYREQILKLKVALPQTPRVGIEVLGQIIFVIIQRLPIQSRAAENKNESREQPSGP